MKLTRLIVAKMVLFLCLSLPAHAQKPHVQVSFDISEDTSIFIAFEETIEDVKTKALDTLVKGLNDYIGFVTFTPEDSSNKLKITLNNKIEAGNSDAFIHEYWLFFELTDAEEELYTHQSRFLGINEIEGVLSNPEALLNKLGKVWIDYLKVAYNLELVNILFDEIALNLPDSSHYINIPGDREAILPFKREMLKINPEKSEFMIIVFGKNSQNSETQETLPEVQFRGLVQAEMDGVPSNLMDCIRIGLKTLPDDMTLEEGKVYITNYRRKLYDENTDEDDSEFDDNN